LRHTAGGVGKMMGGGGDVSGGGGDTAVGGLNTCIEQQQSLKRQIYVIIVSLQSN